MILILSFWGNSSGMVTKRFINPVQKFQFYYFIFHHFNFCVNFDSGQINISWFDLWYGRLTIGGITVWFMVIYPLGRFADFVLIKSSLHHYQSARPQAEPRGEVVPRHRRGRDALPPHPPRSMEYSLSAGNVETNILSHSRHPIERGGCGGRSNFGNPKNVHLVTYVFFYRNENPKCTDDEFQKTWFQND